MRSVTKQAIREARLKEIKEELLHSEKLKVRRCHARCRVLGRRAVRLGGDSVKDSCHFIVTAALHCRVPPNWERGTGKPEPISCLWERAGWPGPSASNSKHA